MNLSQKCQYAVRSLFELAKRTNDGPVRVAEIAEAQAIPPRFLELILAELKRPGWVESRRGASGGYLLAVQPDAISVGDIIRFVDGPLNPVACIAGESGEACTLRGHCAFIGLWERAQAAIEDVYDTTTLLDLIEEERGAKQTLNYTI